MGDILFYDF